MTTGAIQAKADDVEATLVSVSKHLLIEEELVERVDYPGGVWELLKSCDYDVSTTCAAGGRNFYAPKEWTPNQPFLTIDNWQDYTAPRSEADPEKREYLRPGNNAVDIHKTCGSGEIDPKLEADLSHARFIEIKRGGFMFKYYTGTAKIARDDDPKKPSDSMSEFEPVPVTSGLIRSGVLMKNLTNSGYINWTFVQAIVLRDMVKKRADDYVIWTHAAGGKTFCILPALDKMLARTTLSHVKQECSKTVDQQIPLLLGGPKPLPSEVSSTVILEPVLVSIADTHDLTQQHHSLILKLVAGSQIKVALLGGTQDHEKELAAAQDCSIIVSTPGRLFSYVSKKKIGLEKMRYLWIDEVDKVLSPQSRYGADKTGPNAQRVQMEKTFMGEFYNLKAAQGLDVQRILTTATEDIEFLDWVAPYTRADNSLSSNSKLACITLDTRPDMSLDFHWIHHKDLSIARLQLVAGYITERLIGKVLVFVKTRKQGRELYAFLHRLGEKRHIDVLDSAREGTDRETGNHNFQSGSTQIAITCKALATGMNFNDLHHVVVAELYQEVDDFIRRVSRTGRAGNQGECHAFFDPSNAEDSGRFKTTRAVCKSQVFMVNTPEEFAPRNVKEDDSIEVPTLPGDNFQTLWDSQSKQRMKLEKKQAAKKKSAKKQSRAERKRNAEGGDGHGSENGTSKELQKLTPANNETPLSANSISPKTQNALDLLKQIMQPSTTPSTTGVIGSQPENLRDLVVQASQASNPSPAAELLSSDAKALLNILLQGSQPSMIGLTGLTPPTTGVNNSHGSNLQVARVVPQSRDASSGGVRQPPDCTQHDWRSSRARRNNGTQASTSVRPFDIQTPMTMFETPVPVATLTDPGAAKLALVPAERLPLIVTELADYLSKLKMN